MIVPAGRGRARGERSRRGSRGGWRRSSSTLAGGIAVSIGVAHGPEHAANPRELIACAEAAMMTAKARGKNQVVVFDDSATERPEPGPREDIRSIAHLKMLQSLGAKLNRLTDVRGDRHGGRERARGC